jgi:hypothetical protein
LEVPITLSEAYARLIIIMRDAYAYFPTDNISEVYAYSLIDSMSKVSAYVSIDIASVDACITDHNQVYTTQVPIAI